MSKKFYDNVSDFCLFPSVSLHRLLRHAYRFFVCRTDDSDGENAPVIRILPTRREDEG